MKGSVERVKMVAILRWGVRVRSLRERLVVGIKDQKLSESSQLVEKLTLLKAIDKIIQTETIKDENRKVRKHETGTIDRVQNTFKQNNKYKNRRQWK